VISDLLEEEHDHDEEYDRHSVPGRVSGATLTEQGWYAWHAPYDDLSSEQSDRLEIVQDLLLRFFDTAPAGPLRAVSVCSGQSRDLLPILIHHPRGAETRATMLELDPLNASFLHGALGSTSLTDVDVVVGDAGLTAAYDGVGPVDLALLGGVFANVDPADAARTVELLTGLCAPGASVVWTSYGAGLSDAEAVLERLEDGSFERIALHRAPSYVVGAHRFTGTPVPLPAHERVFTFRSS
jgi:hypothetical protein